METLYHVACCYHLSHQTTWEDAAKWTSDNHRLVHLMTDLGVTDPWEIYLELIMLPNPKDPTDA